MDSRTTAPQQNYRDVLVRLAEAGRDQGLALVRDLPELTLEELAAVVRHYPATFLEAMVEYDAEMRELLANTLSEHARLTCVNRYHLLGVHLVAAYRRSVLPLVLTDAQNEIQRQRALDSVDSLSARSEERAAVREAGRLS